MFRVLVWSPLPHLLGFIPGQAATTANFVPGGYKRTHCLELLLISV